MNATIPLLHLDSLTETQVVPTAAPLPHLPLDRPHRNAFYKTGLCLRGSARLRVNLETYELRPASLIVLSPYTNIQCVTRRPADCEARRGPTVQAATGVRWSIHSTLPPRLSPG
jgi:hypothetical protein